MVLGLGGGREDLAARVQQLFDEEIEPLSGHGGDRRSSALQGNPITLKGKRGDSRDYVIARLKRDTPVFERLPERYTDAQILDFIVSTNMARRHLNPGQRAAVAYAYKDAIAASIRAAEAERKSKFPTAPKTDTTVADPQQSKPKMSDSKPSVSAPSARKASAQAAKVTGASPRAVQQFGAVQRDTPDLAEKVRSG